MTFKKSGDQKSSDQKGIDQKFSEQQSSEFSSLSQITSSSSLPNLVLAESIMMHSDKNSPSPKGVRVLPVVGKKPLRRRSLSGTANSGNMPSPHPHFASSTNLKKESPKVSRRPTTTEIEADFVKIELEKSLILKQPATKNTAHLPENKPLTSSTELINTTSKHAKPSRVPKLSINTANLNNSGGESSPSFNLFKNKSTLNISYSNLNRAPSIEPFHIPSGAQSLPIPKNRPLPSPPVTSPPNPFPSLGQSPPIVSPRSGHTPPNRPLPSLPPIPTNNKQEKEPHPAILRRNTVHSDMHAVVKPPFSAEQSRKEIPSEWLAFAQNQVHPFFSVLIIFRF